MNIKQGEIFLAALDPVVRHEITKTNQIRTIDKASTVLEQDRALNLTLRDAKILFEAIDSVNQTKTKIYET